MKKILLLDCTLRDGSYINGSRFGAPAMKGIIKKLQDANVDLIECGWLKDKEYEKDTAYYHVPSDLEPYLSEKSPRCTYVAMIDWDRYNTDNLPNFDGKSIDAVRIVFPHGKQKQGLEVGKRIRDKGYKVYFQASNTMAYNNEELLDLAKDINMFHPEALSVVDTFGAMFFDDLERIIGILDANLDKDIRLGFHSHNNRQLSLALTIKFTELMDKSDRGIILDSSLCGMGRGAGNSTTELVVSYLNRRRHGDYDLDSILDAIDTYMTEFQEKYKWGYSTPYFVAGMYQCHVNNIAYLLKNHNASANDIREVISSLTEEERRHYDYDLLEERYIENQNRKIDDTATLEELKNKFSGRKILLIAPGKSVTDNYEKIKEYAAKNNAVRVGVNAVIPGVEYDYLFFSNSLRYQYAKEARSKVFNVTPKIVLSNIKTESSGNEYVVNYNHAIKRGWPHFDNAVMCCLRLLDKLMVDDVAIAGFDGFKPKYNESYADTSLPSLNPGGDWNALNNEIKDMYNDFAMSTKDKMKISFVTNSIFE